MFKLNHFLEKLLSIFQQRFLFLVEFAFTLQNLEVGCLSCKLALRLHLFGLSFKLLTFFFRLDKLSLKTFNHFGM